MAERYSKARMLHQDEARDDKLRALFDYLPTREDVFGAIVLFHRLLCRLDIQGVVLFEPAWIASECFLGYRVSADEIVRWCIALVDVGVLMEFTHDGFRYAWTDKFYKNQPGLDLTWEEPRYPRPAEWDFDKLIATGRPGPKPRPPAWVNTTQERKARVRPRSTVDLVGARYLAEIEQLENELGEAVAYAVRAYALHFVSEADRAGRVLTTEAYLPILSLFIEWKDAGTIADVAPWDEKTLMPALRDMSSRTFEGKLRSHKYLISVLTNPNKPKEQRQEPGRPSPGRNADLDAKHAVERAQRAWRERVDAYIAQQSAAWQKKLRKEAEAWVDKEYPDTIEAAKKVLTLPRMRAVVSEIINDYEPQKESQ